ncbi:MAG: hypothetical protein QOI86_3507 [Actinomycetota bacterium]|jgi:hypothetical protein|nr:hypothetical protein [Actinomycetota bacterium]
MPPWRPRTVLSIVALRATTLAVATAGPVTTHGATEATASATPITFSPDPRQDRTYRAVLLDGSDRWRSLLLGAPPLFA